VLASSSANFLNCFAYLVVLNRCDVNISALEKSCGRGARFTTEHPEEAFELLCQMKPNLRNEMHHKIFVRSLPFFSRTLFNVDRDWNKVGCYAQHLQIIDKEFDMTSCYTNNYFPEKPHADLQAIACCV
jgi:hypothetical protein